MNNDWTNTPSFSGLAWYSTKMLEGRYSDPSLVMLNGVPGLPQPMFVMVDNSEDAAILGLDNGQERFICDGDLFLQIQAPSAPWRP